MSFRFLIPLTLPLALLAQDRPARPIGGGVNFYSLDREIALGAQLAEQVRRESKALDSDLARDYVARLGRQLAPQAGGPGFTYTFTVVADLPGGIGDNLTHEPMALPGGPIFIPANLILEAQNTAEFSGMLAHAIAHVADRDCTRMKTRAELMQTGAVAPSRSIGCWLEEASVPAIPLGYLAFQRAFESRADYLAIQTMSKAGYDPAALAAYIRRVQQTPRLRQAGSVSRVFSPWPTAEERVKRIDEEIRKLPADRRYPAGEDIEPVQLEVRNLLGR
jgi:predicted Zn-dependent protease